MKRTAKAGDMLYSVVARGEFQEYAVTKVGRKYVYVSRNRIHHLKLEPTHFPGVYQEASQYNPALLVDELTRDALVLHHEAYEISKRIHTEYFGSFGGTWWYLNLSKCQKRHLPEILSLLIKVNELIKGGNE